MFGRWAAICVMCIGLTGPARAADIPPCRQSPGIPVRWIEEKDESDRIELMRRCRACGPPVARIDTSAAVAQLDSLAIVSWKLRAGHFTGGVPVEHFVLLIQEAHRGGPEVPTDYPEVYVPKRRANTPPSGVRLDIVACADSVGLNVFYVPSKRNGEPGSGPVEEDRGNAILSTLPLHDLTAIELPHEKYRRVAIAGTLTVRDPEGRTQNIRICCAHLDNRTRFPRYLMSMGVGRLRQARALVHALPERPCVLGGDFNTWALSVTERAVPHLRKFFPQPARLGKKTTNVARFRPDRRMDYILYDVPEEWNPGYKRIDERFGSDHYPLIGWLRFAN
jgi:endonuclease/exonuclease/phosphatase family metal-dependent hydrolase